MKHNKKKRLWMGIWFLLAFLLWTALIRCVDVQAAGPNGTKVGFAAFNLWFHHLTGVHMSVYTITDWLGLVPIAVCLGFGVVGVFQLIRRKSLIRVDPDILLLGLYYVLVILAYLIFEMIPINYRPILIGGALEASYPSSTTLLGVGCSLGDGHCRFRFAELWFIQALPKRGNRNRFEEQKWSSMKSCRN